MALAESWKLITSTSVKQYRPPFPGHQAQAHTHTTVTGTTPCMTEIICMKHACTACTNVYTLTMDRHSLHIHGEYSGINSLKSELNKKLNEEVKKNL